ISWCGRVYLPSPNTVLARAAVEQQRTALIGDQPYPLERVATVPPVVGAPVLASVTPQAARPPASPVCHGRLPGNRPGLLPPVCIKWRSLIRTAQPPQVGAQ